MLEEPVEDEGGAGAEKSYVSSATDPKERLLQVLGDILSKLLEHPTDKRSRWMKAGAGLWKFLNSPIFLGFVAAILISLATGYMQHRRAEIERRNDR